MDYDAYRRAHFADPQPEPRFDFAGVRGATLFYGDYAAAVAFYTEVLGPPGYVEGEGTRGWRIGDTWLTLLRGAANPAGVEVPIVTSSPEEAERLQAAFVAAGADGEEPVDALMYVPVRTCPVRDPFGVDLLIYCPLG